MRRLPQAPGRVLSGLLALLLASAVTLLASVRPAAAHGTLAMATPAAGATVSDPLTSVRLYFTEKVAANAYFTITAPGGTRVDNGWTYGEPKPLDKPVREYFLVDGQFEPREYATGFPAVVALAHLPATGQYSVSYLSVASDGDPVRGTMTFRYSGRPTAAPQGWSPPTNQPDPTLLASTEQHKASGQASAVPTTPAEPTATPAAAPAVGSADDDGPAALAWTGWVVAVMAAMVAFIGWRRRPAPAGRSSGRARTARSTSSKRSGAEFQASRTSNSRLALLVGGLVLALLAGFGLARIGAATGSPTGAARQPSAGPAAAGQGVSAGDGHQHGPGIGPHTHPGDGGGETLATGTTVSSGGYTLQPLERSQPAGTRTDYRFRIVGADQQPATRFAVVHDKPLHLIVVGRDLTGYQHLHPTMAPDGTWSVPLTLSRPGAYRIYTDFSITATNGTPIPLVLGVDHNVPGAHTPTPLPAPQAQAVAGPYAVAMNGTPAVGVTVPMRFRINRADPVDVQPERYLGAYGHLVVVREGDLGYVHVHPEQELVDGTVQFWLTTPSPGRYRAFFDFQVGGKVHTAEYTINLP
ncbi:copper resistance protein CopC [Micromonospora orduensis]|uniref:Copper resistance protein CopC n=1 Tax=Micromonospora orduensis TaxID=1420891 RepID=A0A5C4QMF3_9ACTN|nr:copper resistance CopC family protein [Micromonospora orduensis]TNH28061.1 copper resistance protein CopC [Micromonospora orduensis]